MEVKNEYLKSVDEFITEFVENGVSPISANEVNEILELIEAMPETNSDVVLAGVLKPDQINELDSLQVLDNLGVALTDSEKTQLNDLKNGTA